MSSSTTNKLTKWSDEQLRENDDDDDELFEKKSVECRCCMKAWKEAERRMAEEVARGGRVGAELGLRPVEGETAEGDGERDRGGCGVCRGLSPMLQVLGCQGGVRDEGGQEQQGKVVRPLSPTVEQVRAARGCATILVEEREEMMSPRARKKKAQTKSPAAEDDEEDAEDCEAEENCDALGALAEVLSAMVGEMWNMAADRRRVAAESHAQMERVLGTLEEIRGCLDLEFVPEEGLEENFKEEEVAGAAEEKEALKGWNEEEEEVDESA
ncbi:hypothetical protein PAXRUDRAFT_19479 [Paxillus rubicundulus Ve08.2h10]|uniref:Uncharacterized protein n=1 Tax=Paxillus rubicundulus Ve08.2h10 TaxID=930991 RepID=A0A0D0CI50_9AGAM|nr:hypothetical protein PAXRUDRAFT_19479 [Paxillus rubicundulus Ve08.2h10]